MDKKEPAAGWRHQMKHRCRRFLHLAFVLPASNGFRSRPLRPPTHRRIRGSRTCEQGRSSNRLHLPQFVKDHATGDPRTRYGVVIERLLARSQNVSTSHFNWSTPVPTSAHRMPKAYCDVDFRIRRKSNHRREPFASRSLCLYFHGAGWFIDP